MSRPGGRGHRARFMGATAASRPAAGHKLCERILALLVAERDPNNTMSEASGWLASSRCAQSVPSQVLQGPRPRQKAGARRARGHVLRGRWLSWSLRLLLAAQLLPGMLPGTPQKNPPSAHAGSQESEEQRRSAEGAHQQPGAGYCTAAAGVTQPVTQVTVGLVPVYFFAWVLFTFGMGPV